MQLKGDFPFSPQKIEKRFRIPLLWPGHKADKSFWRFLSLRDWLRLSKLQLYATMSYVENIESSLGERVLIEALPFFGLPCVKELLGSKIAPNCRALDGLLGLTKN